MRGAPAAGPRLISPALDSSPSRRQMVDKRSDPQIRSLAFRCRRERVWGSPHGPDPAFPIRTTYRP